MIQGSRDVAQLLQAQGVFALFAVMCVKERAGKAGRIPAAFVGAITNAIRGKSRIGGGLLYINT